MFTERFSAYFDREVAQKAAHSLSDGAEIEFQIEEETFTFTKVKGANHVKPGAASDPQIVLNLTSGAAEAILDDESEDIGSIGVHIGKLMVSSDPSMRVSLKLKTGFLTLFSQGYFGILKAGGTEFAGFLTSKGLGGMGAIKDTLKKLKA